MTAPHSWYREHREDSRTGLLIVFVILIVTTPIWYPIKWVWMHLKGDPE